MLLRHFRERFRKDSSPFFIVLRSFFIVLRSSFDKFPKLNLSIHSMLTEARIQLMSSNFKTSFLSWMMVLILAFLTRTTQICFTRLTQTFLQVLLLLLTLPFFLPMVGEGLFIVGVVQSMMLVWALRTLVLCRECGQRAAGRRCLCRRECRA